MGISNLGGHEISQEEVDLMDKELGQIAKFFIVVSLALLFIWLLLK
jgi:hypothetical protein